MKTIYRLFLLGIVGLATPAYAIAQECWMYYDLPCP
ncbi:hypothetical protein Pla22_33150 [Rubripirellula amarantea]|uniref:Uncharacterized protein n=1 Tax=Rubripirellula amarantea TaxID=2527999 RepID=A0A5C5WLD2_9BACT|nr:hypothetical protein Pla22_33150 [Rubripirellula amarantea]